MITFTKEQLIASAHARIEFAEMMLVGELEPLKERTWSIELELARIALASLETEPVAEVCEGFTLRYIGHGPAPKSGVRIGDRLYTAPPAPVSVPDESAVELLATDLMKRIDKITGERHSIATLSSLRVSIVESCRSAMLQGADGNSPAIPDGWVLVPKEPTPAMLNAAWVSHGIYHASAYRTMLAAAPQRGLGDERQADENLA